MPDPVTTKRMAGPATEAGSSGPIRPLRASDRDPLLAILRATGVFSEEEIVVATELIDAVLDHPEQRDYVIFVYEEGSRVLGYYCIGPTPATATTYDLYWIAVTPGVHRKGVGTALNVHLESLIRSRGGTLIMVETSSRKDYEPTREFYHRKGYRELARIRDYYRPADDLVIFGKYLS